jgi:glutamyl/glutaminyl-tRNA synthetase
MVDNLTGLNGGCVFVAFCTKEELEEAVELYKKKKKKKDEARKLEHVTVLCQSQEDL